MQLMIKISLVFYADQSVFFWFYPWVKKINPCNLSCHCIFWCKFGILHQTIWILWFPIFKPENIAFWPSFWMSNVDIRMFGISFKMFLQSVKRGSINKFSEPLFIRITTLNGSSSITKLFNLISLAKTKPSLRAHNSAMILFMCSIPLAYPFIQLPSWSRIKPPPPALLAKVGTFQSLKWYLLSFSFFFFLLNM